MYLRHRLIIALYLLMAPCAVFAHHPDGTMPGGNDVVIARIETRDETRLRHLAREHDLWYYLWKEGYAVIRTDRSRLPLDAVIDDILSEASGQVTGPFRGTGTIAARPCYRTVEQTHADLQDLATTNPTLAQWVDYGDSWEKSQALGGYDLGALVLSNTSIAGPKPVFMVMAAMHARELATAEVATRFAETLFNGYGSDAEITWMLDHFEVHVLPQQNPDGRKMAEAECSSGCSPGWRKNTNQGYCGATSNSRGADLNRNSDSSFWGGSSASGSECNQSYRGPSAASEPETQAIEAYAAGVFPDFRTESPGDYTTPADPNANGVFVSIHSAGDIVFYPWEGTNVAPPNLAGLRSLSQKMGFSTTFAACQNCFLGTASGTTVDNVYERLGVAAYTYEIGSSFGQSCESFEDSVLPLTLAGLMNGLKHSYRPYQSAPGPDTLDVQLSTLAGGAGLLTATADDSRRAVNGGGEPLVTPDAISEIRYSVGVPPWLASETFALTASDGSYDEIIEAGEATLTQDEVGTGTTLVFVYAIDTAGSTGPPTALWVNLNQLFKDNFEGS